MPFDSLRLNEIYEQHNKAGAELFAFCAAELFPCDVLGFTILERSLNLTKSFQLIVFNGGYSSAVGLLRMQLDNLLRFNGIALSHDPHEAAYQVMSGTHISKLKDRSGIAMKDYRLVELLAIKNPWVKDVYTMTSSYIHLSKEHVSQFLARCPVDPNGSRQFNIGDEEDHISASHKAALLNAFEIVTRSVPKIIHEWNQIRNSHGSNEELKKKFNRTV